MGILRYILIVGCLVCTTHVIGANIKDTIEYRAQVWIDKTDLPLCSRRGAVCL